MQTLINNDTQPTINNHPRLTLVKGATEVGNTMVTTKQNSHKKSAAAYKAALTRHVNTKTATPSTVMNTVLFHIEKMVVQESTEVIVTYLQHPAVTKQCQEIWERILKLRKKSSKENLLSTDTVEALRMQLEQFDLWAICLGATPLCDQLRDERMRLWRQSDQFVLAKWEDLIDRRSTKNLTRFEKLLRRRGPAPTSEHHLLEYT